MHKLRSITIVKHLLPPLPKTYNAAWATSPPQSSLSTEYRSPRTCRYNKNQPSRGSNSNRVLAKFLHPVMPRQRTGSDSRAKAPCSVICIQARPMRRRPPPRLLGNQLLQVEVEQVPARLTTGSLQKVDRQCIRGSFLTQALAMCKMITSCWRPPF